MCSRDFNILDLVNLLDTLRILIAVAERKDFVLFFLLLLCAVVLAKVDGDSAFLDQVFVFANVTIAFEQLSACDKVK